MRPKMVVVEWLDAHRTDDTLTGDVELGVVRTTLGWLLQHDKRGVVVAMSKDTSHAEGTSYERGFFIPAQYVQEVRAVTRGRRVTPDRATP